MVAGMVAHWAALLVELKVDLKVLLSAPKRVGVMVDWKDG